MLDLPGYGRAASFPAAWTMDDLVHDLEKRLKTLGCLPAVVAPSISVRQ